MKRSLIVLLMLGACLSAPKRVVVPPPAPQLAPAPVQPSPPVAWEDRARTPGTWSYLRAGNRSVASFADGARVLLTVTCDNRNLTFHRPGPEALVMTITTTTLSERLLGSPDSLTNGAMGTVSASSPLLDAIIYSRGKFMVGATGQPDLILPPWPEIARVVEDCRN